MHLLSGPRRTARTMALVLTRAEMRRHAVIFERIDTYGLPPLQVIACTTFDIPDVVSPATTDLGQEMSPSAPPQAPLQGTFNPYGNGQPTDADVVTSVDTRIGHQGSGWLRKMHITDLGLEAEGLRHMTLYFVNGLGSPQHRCRDCINAMALTCKTLHRWFYTRFDPDDEEPVLRARIIMHSGRAVCQLQAMTDAGILEVA